MLTFPFTVFSGVKEFINKYSTIFNGVDERVSTPIDLSGVTSFTVGSWLYRGSTSDRVDISQSDNANIQRFKFLRNSDNNIYVLLSPATASISNTSVGWLHMVVVFDGSLVGQDRLKLYIDGVLQVLSFSGIPPSVAPVIDVDLFIGFDNGANVYSSGNFDEFVYFSNPLDQIGITQLYNDNEGFNLEDHQDYATLVSWYRMGDGDTSPIIKDNKGLLDASMQNMSQGNFVLDVPKPPLPSLSFVGNSWATALANPLHTPSPEMTIVARVKFPTAVGLPTVEGAIVSKGGLSLTDGGYMLSYKNNSQPYFLCSDGVTNLSTWTNTKILVDTWQTVVLTRKASVANVYQDTIDNTSGSGSTPPTVQDSAFGLQLGSLQSGFFKFEGLIHEVAIYNRELTPTEVTTIGETVIDLKDISAPTGLVSWYRAGIGLYDSGGGVFKITDEMGVEDLTCTNLDLSSVVIDSP